jgi:hypothetical protein
MNLEDEIRAVMRDDHHIQPGWTDPTRRIRAGMRRRRRRHAMTAAISAAAILIPLSFITVPILRGLGGAPPALASPSSAVVTPGQLIPWVGHTTTAVNPYQAARISSADLTIVINAPSSAGPGDVLTYVVVLDNRSNHAISFESCPIVTQDVRNDGDGTDSGGGTYTFGCDVPAVPVHTWVRVEMRLIVSTSAHPGFSTLSWTLDGASGPLASTSVPITIR